MTAEQILDACTHGELAKKFSDPDDVCRPCAEAAIAAAVLAETERCAEVVRAEWRIAENRCRELGGNGGTSNEYARQRLADLEQAIRGGK